MDDPQKSTRSPEFIPQNTAERVNSGALMPVGVITFNQPPALPNDPIKTLREAITSGDTIEKRIKQFNEAIYPNASEQK